MTYIYIWLYEYRSRWIVDTHLQRKWSTVPRPPRRSFRHCRCPPVRRHDPPWPCPTSRRGTGDGTWWNRSNPLNHHHFRWENHGCQWFIYVYMIGRGFSGSIVVESCWSWLTMIHTLQRQTWKNEKLPKVLLGVFNIFQYESAAGYCQLRRHTQQNCPWQQWHRGNFCASLSPGTAPPVQSGRRGKDGFCGSKARLRETIKAFQHLLTEIIRDLWRSGTRLGMNGRMDEWMDRIYYIKII